MLDAGGCRNTIMTLGPIFASIQTRVILTSISSFAWRCIIAAISNTITTRWAGRNPWPHFVLLPSLLSLLLTFVFLSPRWFPVYNRADQAREALVTLRGGYWLLISWRKSILRCNTVDLAPLGLSLVPLCSTC